MGPGGKEKIQELWIPPNLFLCTVFKNILKLYLMSDADFLEDFLET